MWGLKMLHLASHDGNKMERNQEGKELDERAWDGTFIFLSLHCCLRIFFLGLCVRYHHDESI
jgi:hypothetical protein